MKYCAAAISIAILALIGWFVWLAATESSVFAGLWAVPFTILFIINNEWLSGIKS